MPRASTDIRSYARQHTKLALNTLAAIARASDSDAARVSAACALLDRGWGKAQQLVQHEHDEVRIVVRHIVRGEAIDRPLKTINQVTNVTSQEAGT